MNIDKKLYRKIKGFVRKNTCPNLIEEITNEICADMLADANSELTFEKRCMRQIYRIKRRQDRFNRRHIYLDQTDMECDVYEGTEEATEIPMSDIVGLKCNFGDPEFGAILAEFIENACDFSEHALEMCLNSSAGYSNQQLADMYGVSLSTVEHKLPEYRAKLQQIYEGSNYV